MISADNSSSATIQPAEFWLGIKQFNQQDYYACHDTLEAIWLEAAPGEQAFYQGIIQIAVGLYHLTNLNWRGATILLGEGSHRLNVYEEFHGGINVTDLIDQAINWLTALQKTGPNQVQQLACLLDIHTEADNSGIESGEKLTPPQIQLA
ncbi:MAG: DUF309 domain-containing protein [Cyanobacteria bacterium P01_H01_bin.105]